MKNLRIMVLAFLANMPEDKHQAFNEAYELYKQCPDKHFGIERNLNRIGYTEEGLKNLLYDLQKLNGISDLEIADYVSPDVVQFVPEKTELQLAQEELDIAVQSLSVLLSAKKSNKNKIAAANKLVLALIEKVSDMLEAQAEAEAEALLKAVEPVVPADENTLLAGKLFDHIEMPEDAPEGFKAVSGEELVPIREEFPFLNDESCPEIMFVVVGKRISAYRKYQALHAQLQEVAEGTVTVTDEERTQLATDCDAAADENKKLWDELNYYAANGEILGKHPLFRESVAKKEVDAMTTDQLAKFRNSSAKFISVKKDALAKQKNADKKAEIEQAIADRQFKLDLVNTRLGANSGK